MSKIGKINISIPEKVKVDLSANNVNIEGPLGKKSLNIDSKIFDFPNGPSTCNIFPFKANFTLSGISILIFPILDIKIPYKLFRHLFFVFLRQHLS